MDLPQHLGAPVSVSVSVLGQHNPLAQTCLPVEIGHEMMMDVDTLSSVL